MSSHRARTASNLDLDRMPPEVREAVEEEARRGPREPRKQPSGTSNQLSPAVLTAMAEMDKQEAKKAEMAKRKKENEDR